jgi:hypothetical protein
VQHPDVDDLALLALDESVGPDVDAHVATCPQCAAEVDAFRTTVGLAALSNFGENAPHPGENVWRAIADELGLEPVAGGVATAVALAEPVEVDSVALTGPTGPTVPFRADDPAAPDTSARPHKNGSNGVALTSVPGTGTGTGGGERPSASPPRRWSRWVAPLAAAAVGIALGAGAVVISQNRGSDVTVEAVAPLTAVPDGPLAADRQRQLGQAELVAAPTGTQVKVIAPDLPPTTNHSYEVWLFGNDGRMVSLGTLNNGDGTFTVPQGISTQEYRTVDVSDEPPNGNPAHSGISLVRGSFS